MLLLPASEEFVSEFPSPRHPSSPGYYSFGMYGLKTSTDSSAGLALRDTGNHKLHHSAQVEIPLEGDD